MPETFMKAITLWQPWASLIALGHKTIETRVHDRFGLLRNQRIAIHAGKRFDDEAGKIISGAVGRVIWLPSGLDLGVKLGWPFGKVVCTAMVAATRWLTDLDTRAVLCQAAGLFGLVLRDIRKLEPPIAASGRQGIWEWKNNAAAN